MNAVHGCITFSWVTLMILKKKFKSFFVEIHKNRPKRNFYSAYSFSARRQFIPFTLFSSLLVSCFVRMTTMTFMFLPQWLLSEWILKPRCYLKKLFIVGFLNAFWMLWRVLGWWFMTCWKFIVTCSLSIKRKVRKWDGELAHCKGVTSFRI